jgi:AcrR family transcriptional regulator
VARTVNPAAHAVRRDAFLDAAERRIRTGGYEQMSLQDLLDDVDASRGAFYHYFESKEALLEAVVERMADAAIAAVAPIAAEPGLPAAAKLQAVVRQAGRWKAERKDLLLALLRVWLSDHNAIVRERLRRASTTRLAPLLTGIVRQGAIEGAFTVTMPEHAAEVLVALLQGMGETSSQLFLAREADAVPLEHVERTFAAYSEAFERVLGLPEGSIELVDAPTLSFWYA